MSADESVEGVLATIATGHEARSHFVLTGQVRPGVRHEVAQAWRRSLQVEVAPRDAPGVAPGDAVVGEDRRRRGPHPLVAALADRVAAGALVSADLRRVSVLVLDDLGVVLSRGGGTAAGCEAVEAGFVVGAGLDEAVAGSTAVGLAMATGEHAHVAGPEHLSPSLTSWTTAAAPLRETAASAPIGYLVAAERMPCPSPMLLAWVRLAGSVVEAEWRLHARGYPA